MILESLFGDDPYVYGVQPNTQALEMAQTFSLQQSLTERKQPWDEIFPIEILYREERT
jgi:hypothetical protein